jgi:catechol 2,3-dioxygenase-like lactoylglutathione lyase family enzyme
MLLLFDPASTTHHTIKIGDGVIPSHGASGASHLAFRVLKSELADWRNQLQQHQVPIESEIAWPQGGHSIYFRDPSGNSLEFVTPTVWGLLETTPR